MKKNIVITALHMRHGGVEMAITLLANALVKKCYNVEIFCVYNLGHPVYGLDERVKIRYLTKVVPNRKEFLDAIHSKRIFSVIKEGFYALWVLYNKYKCMKMALKSISDGIVIATRNEHSILLSKYCKKEIYKIAQLHHDHEFKRKYIVAFQKKYLNIDVFVVLTEGLKSEIEKIWKAYNSHTHCVVIPNFLAGEKVSEDINQMRKKTVVTVGRLHPVKGFERLLSVWNEVRKENKEWCLKIIGDGESKTKLENLVTEYNLGDSVIMTGALSHDKVMKELKDASIFAMTSYTEAFPFVLIEAMCNGLPIIAYDVRVGPRAIVTEGMQGYLIPDNDEDEYICKLLQLMEAEEIRAMMRKNAQMRTKEFMEEEVMLRWMKILEKKE